MMDSIIWDWNGTLLNDLDLCISTINKLLKKRNLSLLNKDSYKDIFSFPVKNYYQAIGFDFQKENFEIPANEFIELYDKNINDCLLHSSAVEILAYFKNRGARQFVLSAMKQTMLEETLDKKNILHYFEAIAGLNEQYAVSKIDRGQELIDNFRINRKTAWIIGDTDHDFEVAETLGINCILIADGHQSKQKLSRTGAVVIDSLHDLKSASIVSGNNHQIE